MQMQRKYVDARMVAAVAAVVLLSGCASAGRNPDVVVDHIAGYGARVSQILVDAQELVVKATPSLIPEATTAKVQVQFKEASAIGLKLTDALELYDALDPNNVTERTVAVGNITKLITELRKYTRVALVFIGQNQVGDQVLKLWDNLEDVFTEIQLGIDKWQLSR